MQYDEWDFFDLLKRLKLPSSAMICRCVLHVTKENISEISLSGHIMLFLTWEGETEVQKQTQTRFDKRGSYSQSWWGRKDSTKLTCQSLPFADIEAQLSRNRGSSQRANTTVWLKVSARNKYQLEHILASSSIQWLSATAHSVIASHNLFHRRFKRWRWWSWMRMLSREMDRNFVELRCEITIAGSLIGANPE